MSDIAVKVENLSKLYHIGARQEQFATLRDALVSGMKRLTTRRSALETAENDLWALKDVSFEVKQGEVVGIIGRNGAGKSTLLKILAHITEPTQGRVSIYGRVGSLLEVGTGFHPELTGRDNIYLNGAILGMKRAEIQRKFDEIVAFSEIEKFLDTPVKRYSSGMYVRLAFAVAAHLEPEILVVDEVLAVGDFAFQKKCLGKMGDVAQSGRTVLFVSHNMGAIETLCKRALLLEKGRVADIGDVHQVVSRYTSNNISQTGNPFLNCVRSGIGDLRVTSFHMEGLNGKELAHATSGESVVFVIGFQNQAGKNIRNVSAGISMHTSGELGLLLNYSHFSDVLFENLPEQGQFRCHIPKFPLTPGNYLVMLRIVAAGVELDWPKVFIPISVIMGDFYGVGMIDGVLSSWGYFQIESQWSVNNTTSSLSTK